MDGTALQLVNRRHRNVYIAASLWLAGCLGCRAELHWPMECWCTLMLRGDGSPRRSDMWDGNAGCMVTVRRMSAQCLFGDRRVATGVWVTCRLGHQADGAGSDVCACVGDGDGDCDDGD